MTSPIYSTREGWLNAAVDQLRPLYTELGHDLPKVYLSVGFPGGGNKRTTIGECWNGIASADGNGHIFISPVLAAGIRVLDVLTHELVHAINHRAGQTGHGKCFSSIAKPLGLTGKMTATVAGPELTEKHSEMLVALGGYPHSALSLGDLAAKKQSTRMLKVECECCGYVVRTTAKWLELGLPSCPSGTLMVRSEA